VGHAVQLEAEGAAEKVPRAQSRATASAEQNWPALQGVHSPVAADRKAPEKAVQARQTVPPAAVV
jgi:hypothetical protein